MTSERSLAKVDLRLDEELGPDGLGRSGKVALLHRAGLLKASIRDHIVSSWHQALTGCVFPET